MSDKTYYAENWLAAEKVWESHGGKRRRPDEHVWPVGVRIHHRHSYPEADVVEFEVRDFTSGRTLFAMRLDPGQFAAAVAGNMEGVAGLVPYAEVGLRHEHDTVEVVVPEALEHKLYVHGSGGRTLTPMALNLIAEHETEGWTVSHSDFGNHHRRTKRGYMCSRHRFLPVSHAEARAAVFKEVE